LQGTTRTSTLAVLLTGLLVCVALVTSCGGDEEVTQDQTTDQDTQPTSEESAEERTEAPNKGSDGKAGGGEATREIGGDEGTEFSGSCAVGDKTSELSGQAPGSFTFQLDGERLDCEINASGNLEVVLSVGNNTRSIQQISEGTLNLTYENGQVSSSVNSSGSGGASSSSQVVSSSQSSSSSIELSP
jgi:hypothetical protein